MSGIRIAIVNIFEHLRAKDFGNCFICIAYLMLTNPHELGTIIFLISQVEKLVFREFK